MEKPNVIHKIQLATVWSPIGHQKEKLVTKGIQKRVKMPRHYQIQPRKGRVKKNGLTQLWLNIRIDGQRVRIPLDISVPEKKWDSAKERVKGRDQSVDDLNLEIDAVKSRVSDILIEFRLGSIEISKQNFLDRFNLRDAQGDFLNYMAQQIERQDGLLKKSTLKQQRSTYQNLKKYTPVVPFPELTTKWVDGFISFMRKRGCVNTTIHGQLKNLKKYVRMADKDGFKFPMSPSDIVVKKFSSMRTFLSRKELTSMQAFFNSTECYGHEKDCLRKFLFSCYTGLRISDVQKIDNSNLEGNILFFQSQKAGKIQRLTLSNNALKLIMDTDSYGNIFPGTKNPIVINRTLKQIAQRLKINKNVSFHVARHTFATLFLELGGDVTVLQKILGHSKIEETMTYVHITPTRKAEGLGLLDKL